MSTRIVPDEDTKSGQVVAKQKNTRFHVDHWKNRIFHKTFKRDGVRHTLPEWSVRLQHLGRREAFSLNTANAAVAALKAKQIGTFLAANGWAATVSKFKPGPMEKSDVCTVGEFLAAIGKDSGLKPQTVVRYAIKARKLIADIAKVDRGLSAKQRRAKFFAGGEGRKAWLEMVHKQSLSVLNPDSIRQWRNHYVARAGVNPLKRASAERSAASILRCTRALFSADVTAGLKIKLPSYPFEGVKLEEPKPQRYRSGVNAEWLLVCAERELRLSHPQQFLGLFLCLWAGLRRKEADLLTWEQIDFTSGRIEVRRTEFFEPKTEESQRQVDLSPQAVEVLRGFRKGATSLFVMEGGDPRPEALYVYYRANPTWRALNSWLRSKGVKETKAVHSLRKESGSLIASAFGIEAARQHLGHSDIRTTSAHYVDKKRRIEVSLSVGTEVAS